jgi:hypothetical protein
MPMFDWGCPKCKTVHTEILSYDEYEAWKPIPCPTCGAILHREDRIIGSNIKSIIKGTTKGNH